MTEGDDAGAVPPCRRDAERHRLAADDLADAVIAVDDDGGAGFEDNARTTVDHDAAGGEVADIARPG